MTDDLVTFALSVVDSVPEIALLDDKLQRSVGRKRHLTARALMTALLVLALDDRPVLLKEATKLLYFKVSSDWRQRLGIVSPPGLKLVNAYRCVRYLFAKMTELVDPSIEKKNRVMPIAEHQKLRKNLARTEIAEREKALQALMSALVHASVMVCTKDELSGFCGNLVIDATPVKLFSRGSSKASGLSASDPDGGWYVRDPDTRDADGPDGRRKGKWMWATEATLLATGDPAGDRAHPNLVADMTLGVPAVDPGGTGAKLLYGLTKRWKTGGVLAGDRGYTQTRPERFHLPVKALGYSIVMDYKATELGHQLSHAGAFLVEGAFYCPAMPPNLINATKDLRAGTIGQADYQERIEARRRYKLRAKEGSDERGSERLSCPALTPGSGLDCPLRPCSSGLGRIPVNAPGQPPRVCTQVAITVPVDVGARFRQHLDYGSAQWHATYARLRNTIEGVNGYLKDAAHECLAEPGRRRVRGIAAQSILCALLVMAGNVRKIESYRARATRQPAKPRHPRSVSLADFLPTG